MDTTLSAAQPNRMLRYGYLSTVFFLTLSGFAQMPIFKRYYIADIPGLGWLAKFFVTHSLHYAVAAVFLGLAAYWIGSYLAMDRGRLRITPSGYLRGGLLLGIVITGGLMVVKNLNGTYFSPAAIIFLDLAHLGMVMGFLATALACLALKKQWTSRS